VVRIGLGMIPSGAGLLLLGFIPVAFYWHWRNDTSMGSWMIRFNIRVGLVIAAVGLAVLAVALVLLALGRAATLV
jgi:hypothetical protein